MPQERILTIVYLMHIHYIVLYHIYNVYSSMKVQLQFNKASKSLLNVNWLVFIYCISKYV